MKVFGKYPSPCVFSAISKKVVRDFSTLEQSRGKFIFVNVKSVGAYVPIGAMKGNSGIKCFRVK